MILKELIIKLLKNIFGILGFSAPLITELSWKYNVAFIGTGLLISAIIYLLFELHEIDHKKYLKVKGRFEGDGIYSGINIIRIESNPKIPKDSLLTLITEGSGIPNSICILRIIESVKGSDIQAIQILPEERHLDIQNYFADINKLNNLYVSSIIKDSELHTLKNLNNESI